MGSEAVPAMGGEPQLMLFRRELILHGGEDIRHPLCIGMMLGRSPHMDGVSGSVRSVSVKGRAADQVQGLFSDSAKEGTGNAGLAEGCDARFPLNQAGNEVDDQAAHTWGQRWGPPVYLYSC